MTFNTQSFIFEIENRPALWDPSIKDYTNRDLKKRLWREVVNLFGGEELTTEKDKKELGLSLQRKWKNLRDSFAREIRRLKQAQNGLDSTRKSQYIYYKQMLFLKNSISNSTCDNNIQDVSSPLLAETSTSSSYLSSPPKKKKKSDDPICNNDLINSLCKSVQRIEEFERHSETDEDRMFLLSLLPELKKISEHLKFPTKMEIMNVIQKAKMGSGYGSDVPTYYQMTPVQPSYVPTSNYEIVPEQPQFQTCVVSELKVSPTEAPPTGESKENPDMVIAPKEEILNLF